MVFNTYHHTRTCLDEKFEIDEKKFQKIFSLPISLRVTLKLSLRSRFSAKKHFFVFCRKFGFNLEKLSNHYSQLKKHLKVDPETRSYDFLTKTHEKNPMSRNILISWTTLGCHLIIPFFLPKSSNIKNPLLQPFRAHQTDTFTYLLVGRFRIQSRQKITCI